MAENSEQTDAFVTDPNVSTAQTEEIQRRLNEEYGENTYRCTAVDGGTLIQCRTENGASFTMRVYDGYADSDTTNMVCVFPGTNDRGSNLPTYSGAKKKEYDYTRKRKIIFLIHHH